MRLVTDANAASVNLYDYDADGVVEAMVEGFPNPFTFTGREADGETGLYYYRTRHYDPRSGRFSSEDPIDLASLDPNLYRYVPNNPENLTDPEGEAFNVVTGVLGGVIGGVANGVSAGLDGKPVGRAILVGAAAGAIAGFTLNPVLSTVLISGLTEAANITFDPCRELFSSRSGKEIAIAVGAGFIGGKVSRAVGAEYFAAERIAIIRKFNFTRPPYNRARSFARNIAAQKAHEAERKRALERAEFYAKLAGAPAGKFVSRQVKKAGKNWFVGDESSCPCR